MTMTRIETLRAASRSMRQHIHEGNPDVRADAAAKMEDICNQASEMVFLSQDPGYTEQQIFNDEPFREALKLAEAWLHFHPLT